MLTFKDRIILITGASRGIGRAAAIKFAEAGAAGVVINYHRSKDSAEEVAGAVERAGAKALVIQADVSRADEAVALVEKALDHFRRLDVLVANAGIWPVEDRAITDLDEAQWDETIRINVNGIYHVCRTAARIFVAQRGGNIVTISSTAGQRGEAGHADYAASKGAVISFTKSLASELGRFNVRVNSVAPGWVDTDMAASALRENEAQLKQIRDAIPLGRIATADDLAGPILFLASDLARHITGEILNVNGGSVLCG
ncbi:MAG: SDR family oxidoreductase [Acidobacteria bacterium]|nr:SDR family oxidoreductase [Acidobacteriota bacterium]